MLEMKRPEIFYVELDRSWSILALAEPEITAWCEANCKGIYRRLGRTRIWQFANASDAVLFKLFWA